LIWHGVLLLLDAFWSMAVISYIIAPSAMTSSDNVFVYMALSKS